MDLRISVEKSSYFRELEFVSLYLERSKKKLKKSNFFFEYMRVLYDFSPLLAVAAGGRNEGLTVFRRCAAPEKIRIVRTEGSNSGEWGRLGIALFMGKRREKKTKKVTK